MKIKLLKKEFPLVALVLIAIGLGSGLLAFNYTVKAVVLINSDEQLRMSYDEDPDVLVMQEYPSVGNSQGFELDYFFRSIPEPTTLIHPLDRNLKTKEVNQEALYGKNFKVDDTVGFIKVGDFYYKLDWNKTISEGEGVTDIREVEKGRTAWLVSFYGPKALTFLSVSVVSISLAIALLASYKKGYVTKRNVTLIKFSAFAVGLAAISTFVAKGLMIIGVFGEFGIGNLWEDLLIGSVIPALLVLASIIGLSNIVIKSMNDSLQMKEDIDGTI